MLRLWERLSRRERHMSSKVRAYITIGGAHAWQEMAFGGSLLPGDVSRIERRRSALREGRTRSAKVAKAESGDATRRNKCDRRRQEWQTCLRLDARRLFAVRWRPSTDHQPVHARNEQNVAHSATGHAAGRLYESAGGARRHSAEPHNHSA